LSCIEIQGGHALSGTVRVSGRKNSAVALMPATIVSGGRSRLENIPNITDVGVFAEMLRAVGARVSREQEDGAQVLEIDASAVEPNGIPEGQAKKLRASYYFLGALLGRFGEAEVPLPGGCDIGLRPIDQHVKGLEAMGAQVSVEHGLIRARAARLEGAVIYLDVVSVGATINIMLAGVLAHGVTVIENAAKEPHVVDLANYLNACGCHVQGAGTDVIKIRGVAKGELHGASHAMIAGCATHGDVVVENVIPKHLAPVSAKLEEVGAEVWANGDLVRVRMNSGRPRAAQVTTLPYPGFPTDAQQPMTVLLALADGASLVTETIWEGRFKHIPELNRMGARCRVEGRTAFIQGVERLSGAPVQASDLRAAAALVLAGLVAEGRTEISGIEHLDRGYSDAVRKFEGLGAKMLRG
jgi:UDP-N-acetylglucosamine 1-carboxyvinyltransferase